MFRQKNFDFLSKICDEFMYFYLSIHSKLFCSILGRQIEIRKKSLFFFQTYWSEKTKFSGLATKMSVRYRLVLFVLSTLFFASVDSSLIRISSEKSCTFYLKFVMNLCTFYTCTRYYFE